MQPATPTSATSGNGSDKAKKKGLLRFLTKKKKDMKPDEPSSPGRAMTQAKSPATSTPSEKSRTLLPEPQEDLLVDTADELHPENQKDWSRIDDEHASSEESSVHSDISDDTQGSLIKRKLQAIGAFAGKMKKKLELDRPSDQAYETLPDGARDFSRETSSPESRKETRSIATQEDKGRGGSGASVERSESATPHGGENEWRSAIDAGSGLPYYYIKGTSTVTWEKPQGF